MQGTKHMLIILLVTLLAPLSSNLVAQDEGNSGTEDFGRKTPSGQYIDPASFFRFHGYVTLSMAQAQSGLGSEFGMAPQILISGLSPRTGKNESGFKNDAALFVGGEPLNGIGSVIEIHFVGNGLNPVITEAKLTWIAHAGENSPFSLRLSGGRFWWPFGNHNDEWFSAVNNFSVVSPAASEVVPAHYNEVGVMVEGEVKFGKTFGANYVFSVGNGVPSFELMDNVTGTSFDHDGNRTVTSRFALVLKRSVNLELGVSGSGGKLRSGESDDNGVNDPRRYAADFLAFGPDLSLTWRDFGLKSYYYISQEDLENAPRGSLDRDGLTVEPSYTVYLGSKNKQKIKLVGRFSFANEEFLDGSTYRRTQYALGMVCGIKDELHLRVGYVFQGEERSAPKVRNNVFNLGLTAQF